MKIQLKKKDTWKAYLTIGIILLILIIGYFVYFFHYNCDTRGCFQAHQKDCAKTRFVDDQEDNIWEYFIEGREGDKCKINVKLVKIKKGSIDKQQLEGEEMDCYLPLGSLVSPESDISRCHGILKEEMQDLIIRRLHSYIISNVGEIGKELEAIINNS